MKERGYPLGKRPGIFASLFSSITLLVILPLCFGMTWLGIQMGEHVNRNTLEVNETFVSQIASNTSQLIQISNYATSILMVDSDVLLKLRSLSSANATYDQYLMKADLQKKLSNLESSVLNAVNGKLALLSPSGYLLGTSNMGQVPTDYQQEQWYLTILENGRKTTFMPQIVQLFNHLQLDAQPKSDQHLYFGRSVLGYSGAYLGMIVVQISTDKLWDSYLGSLSENAGLFLFNEYKTAQVKRSAEAAEGFDYAAQQEIWELTKGARVHGDSGKWHFSAYHLADSPLILVYVESLDSFYHYSHELARSMWTLIVVLICVTLGLMVVLSSYLTRPIVALSQNLQTQRDGALHVHAGQTPFRELHDLVFSYNEAGKRISDLIERVRQESRLKEKANYEVLISQISPHFLFNTVNAIKYLAMQRGDKPVEEELTALGEILHLVYEAHADLTTIERETQLLSAYVKIMRMRFSDSFQYINIVPAELYPYEIPSFTLQPIVENAILHGVRDMSAGQIVVSAVSEGEDLLINVFNNGETPDLEWMTRLLNEAVEEKGKITGIGLNNINRRLKALYGNAYGLSVNQSVSVGLEVCVRLPMRVWKEEK